MKIKQLKAAERYFLALEKSMRDAFGLPEGHPALLSRRQLQKIAEGRDIPLRFEQLELLDRYLRLRGHESLAEIFNPPSVLRWIADHGRVAFIVGSQPSRDDVRPMDFFSRWDINSMQTIQRALYATGRGLHIRVEDVILRDRNMLGERAERVRAEEWYQLAANLESQGDSLIVLGSPRVNHGAEKVLAAMLEVEPFVEWNPEALAGRPFAFFWPGWTEENHSPSCLYFDPDTAARCGVRIEDEDLHWLQQLSRQGLPHVGEDCRFDCGIVANRRFYSMRRGDKEGASYAILAARRGQHRTFACICGATGPATLAAAKVFVSSFVPRLKDGKEVKDDCVAWCLVKADVRNEGDAGSSTSCADPRVVVSEEIVDGEIHFHTPRAG